MNVGKQYHQIVNKILIDYLNIPRQYQNVESKLIVSEDRNDYIIFVYGTHDTESVHECILHIQIEDDKIIVRRDNTKYNLFDKLLNAKVPSDKIIYPDAPQLKITDYSVSLEKIYEIHGSLFEVRENFTKALKIDISSSELAKLAAIKHEYINYAIASHPNTPPELLKDFFPKFPLQVLTNPILDLLLLEQPKFIEELFDAYHYFFQKNNLKEIKDIRKWAASKKQEDIDINTSVSNINSIFISNKRINVRRKYVIQNLCKNARLPLNTKNNPAETMQSLDDFLSNYFGDCKVEYNPDLAAIKARQLPLSLKYLYSFIGKYPGQHGDWLHTQDTLVSGNRIFRGKRSFLYENQGCWEYATELDGYDPPVWIDGVLREEGYKYVCDSLSQFLITFCFQEAIFASKYYFAFDDSIDNIVSTLQKENIETTLLWQGTYANDVWFNNDYNFRNSNSFYLAEDSILIGNRWCGTNYKNAEKLLTSFNFKLHRLN